MFPRAGAADCADRAAQDLLTGNNNPAFAGAFQIHNLDIYRFRNDAQPLATVTSELTFRAATRFRGVKQRRTHAGVQSLTLCCRICRQRLAGVCC